MSHSWTIDDSILELERSGLAVSDHDAAGAWLANVGHIRLRQYADALGRTPGRSGPTFELARRAHDFDRALRHVVGAALEDIEIALRTRVASVIAQRHGPFGHLDPTFFEDDGRFVETARDIAREVARSKDTFVDEHRRSAPGTPLPIWATTETLSFGTLSKLFCNLRAESRAVVAAAFDLHEPVIRGTVQHLASVRNICAHHGRLWERSMVRRLPRIRRPTELGARLILGDERAVYRTLLVTDHMVRSIGHSATFDTQIRALVTANPELAGGLRGPRGWDGALR